MAGFDAVFFDVDGTLWDAVGCLEHAMQIALPKLMPYLPDEDPPDVIRRFNAVLLDRVGQHGLAGAGIFSRQERFAELLKLYDVRKEALLSELTHTFEAARRLSVRSFLRRGAEELLKTLRQDGITVGVIANGSPAICRQTLKLLGLERHVQHAVIGGAEGFSKPDPRLFARAAELTQVKPDRMLYVGDSPITDVLGASRAGIAVAWLDTGRRILPHRFPEPAFTITRLAQVLALL